ncbi:MAG: hypothetical protein O3C57_00090 [Verrucomicrobia bacterium]|nr:hypothetical protein [Verrucomicrobiota bacterium]
MPGGFLRRFLSGLLVAAIMSLLMGLGAFAPIETPIEEFLFSGRYFGIPGLGLHFELLIIFILTLSPCLWRMDQPLLLVAYAFCIGFVYLMIASVVLLTTERVLPIVPAMLGLIASTVIVGSGSWAEERRKRKHLERQDLARQEFTDMLVHDMKKRMSAILMSVSVLERQEPNKARQPVVDTIRASAERMLLLASNLLDIRRVEENRMNLDRQAVSLQKLVKESLSEHQFASTLTGIQVAMREDRDARVSVDRSIFTSELRKRSCHWWNYDTVVAG